MFCATENGSINWFLLHFRRIFFDIKILLFIFATIRKEYLIIFLIPHEGNPCLIIDLNILCYETQVFNPTEGPVAAYCRAGAVCVLQFQ